MALDVAVAMISAIHRRFCRYFYLVSVVFLSVSRPVDLGWAGSRRVIIAGPLFWREAPSLHSATLADEPFECDRGRASVLHIPFTFQFIAH
jgi:hypothetical protein